MSVIAVDEASGEVLHTAKEPSGRLQSSVLPVPSAAKFETEDEDAREIDDPSSIFPLRNPQLMRQLIFDEVYRAFASMPDLVRDRYTLRLGNVRYVSPREFSPDEEKRAIISGQSLAWPLYGVWQLIDNRDGRILETKRSLLAHVPYMTNRGTFVYHGSDYSIKSQLRLRPGVFIRVKENGEIESHVNVLPRQGVSHRVYFDPGSLVFRVRVGQSDVPLIGALRALGATDAELRNAWGNEIFLANAKHDSARTVHRLVQQLVRDKAMVERLGPAGALASVLSQMRVDPRITYRKLGAPYEYTNKDLYLALTQRLIEASKSSQVDDDRDQLGYQYVLTPAQLLAERIEKDYGNLRADLMRRVALEGSLKAVRSGYFDPSLYSVFAISGLGQHLEETNVAEVLDKLMQVTRLGEGGIASPDAAPDSARNVQTSYLGFIDPVKTPESMTGGLDMVLGSHIYIDRRGNPYVQVINRRRGKMVYATPRRLLGKTIVFPGELETGKTHVRAVKDGALEYVNRDEVDYILPYFEHTFSPLSNLLPMKSASHGQRSSMGARMIAQALPLEQPESPLVRNAEPESGKSYDEYFGSLFGVVRADKPATVVGVNNDEIVLRYEDGTKKSFPLYRSLPFNRRSLLTQRPLVRLGQVVGSGQVLATSNFADDEGALALGKNLRVAYMPAKGYNFEDAIVVSESAAKKLSSEHMFQETVDPEDDRRIDYGVYVSLFPDKYRPEQLQNIDARTGVVKPGSIVRKGDPLILAVRAQVLTYNPEELTRRLRRKPLWKDASVVWDRDMEGEVVDVFLRKDGFKNIIVRAIKPLEVGDKLTGRYGDKGIVSAIWPDSQMPHDEQGQPYEILLNPLGIISRLNPAQIYETVLGEIAYRRGRPYVLKDFDPKTDWQKFVQEEMAKHGVEAFGSVIDPQTGRKIKHVLTGRRYIMKLHHLAEEKEQGRAVGRYSHEEIPSKGGDEGAKRLGLLNTYALLAHGAMEFQRDASAVRGQRSEDYWAAIMRGLPPPPVRVPLVFRKFVNSLRAAGIHVIPSGTRINIMAMRRKDVEDLVEGRFLKNAETINPLKKNAPVDGGLFDPVLTGGPYAARWAGIALVRPVLNPIMEDPIRTVLGLTKPQFEEVISGKRALPNGRSGLQGLAQTVEELDVDKAIKAAEADLLSTTRQRRIAAMKRLRYLRSFKKLKTHPREWFWNVVPVLPPRFRPIAQITPDGLLAVSDPNFLYKEVFEANENIRRLAGAVDQSALGEEELALYRAVKAVAGLAAPAQKKLREKRVRGILEHIFGDTPKFGVMQRKLLGSQVDLTGRAVIIPNPDLDMDSIALPEDKAWTVYKMFVIRHLRRRGMRLVEAMREVERRTPRAREALLAEMAERPVVADRAPVLHRYGMMAFWPRLTKNRAIEVSPLIVKGFNADFDGDAMSFHVPVSEEARREVIERMLPSRNLISPRDFTSPIHYPTQEYVLGLYFATRAKKTDKPPKVFATVEDVRKALMRGEIEVSDPVVVLRKQEPVKEKEHSSVLMETK